MKTVSLQPCKYRDPTESNIKRARKRMKANIVLLCKTWGQVSFWKCMDLLCFMQQYNWGTLQLLWKGYGNHACCFKSISSVFFLHFSLGQSAGAFHQQRNVWFQSSLLSCKVEGYNLASFFFSKYAGLSFIWAENHLFTWCFSSTNSLNSHIFTPSEVIISSIMDSGKETLGFWLCFINNWHICILSQCAFFRFFFQLQIFTNL